MSAKTKLSAEMHNAIVWLERQPGVTGVVQGRYTSARHHYNAGYVRIGEATPKVVVVRVYDAKGVKDLHVYCPPSPQRDTWIGAVALGRMEAPSNGVGHASGKLLQHATVTPEGPAPAYLKLHVPAAVDPQAGQTFDVTPELAATWLERNTRNRALRNDIVQRYASDMKAGRWMVTGDAIAFDKNGAIVNGQHRLWAVLEANLTVRMLVTFNLDPDVVGVLDDHLKRKIVDVAHILRPTVNLTSKHTSIANAMLRASVAAIAVDKRSVMARISRQAQLAFLEKHLPAIDFAWRECFHTTSTRGLTVTGVMAPVARAYYTQDKDRLRQFGQVMLNGMTEGPADSAAILLRNWLMRLDEGVLRGRLETVYRRTERALDAFLKREPLKRALFEASTELFPLPEEQVTKKAKA